MVGRSTLSLMNPRSARLDYTGHGSIREVTPEAVSAVLGHLPRHIARYAFLKWVFCPEDMNGAAAAEWRKSFRFVCEHIQTFVGAHFERLGHVRVIKLSEVILFEDLSDQGRCGACRGVGSILLNQSVCECDFCHGSGRYRFTAERKAEWVGLASAKSWDKSCKEKAEFVQSDLISNWHRVIDRQLRIHLR